jgi:hypothetical protein
MVTNIIEEFDAFNFSIQAVQEESNAPERYAICGRVTGVGSQGE